MCYDIGADGGSDGSRKPLYHSVRFKRNVEAISRQDRVSGASPAKPGVFLDRVLYGYGQTGTRSPLGNKPP